MSYKKCLICGTECTEGGGSIYHHLKRVHQITSEEYFNQYLRVDEFEGACKWCGEPTEFGKKFQYREFCSRKCSHAYLLTTPEYQEALKNSGKKFMEHHWKQPEFIDKVTRRAIETSKERWQNDQSYRELMKEAVEKKWADPEFQKLMIIQTRKRFCDPEYIEKMRKFNSNRWKTDLSYRTKMTENAIRLANDPNSKFGKLNNVRSSSAELEVFDYVKTLFPSAESNKKIVLDNNQLFPDITVGNKIIEYNGNYWHTREDKVLSDIKRYELFLSHGYKFMLVWSSEWEQNTDEVKQRIVEFLIEENDDNC